MSGTGGAFGWWDEMRPREGGGDRGALARLRRCTTVAELMLLPETMALHRRLRAARRDLPEVALVAGVLATVREHQPMQSVARQVGPADPEKPETALLKPLRFRRLMEAATPDERLLAFRRLVALADRSLNVHDLAAALLHWTEERRQRWTYDYWNAGDPPGPATS